MSKENIIKKLTTEKTTLSRDVFLLQKQQEDINKEILRKRKEISQIDKKINLVTKDFAISEHAILRMLERVYEQGDVIEEVKRQLAEEIKPKLALAGVVSCTINLKCGKQAIIDNNLVVTIK